MFDYPLVSQNANKKLKRVCCNGIIGQDGQFYEVMQEIKFDDQSIQEVATQCLKIDLQNTYKAIQPTNPEYRDFSNVQILVDILGYIIYNHSLTGSLQLYYPKKLFSRVNNLTDKQLDKLLQLVASNEQDFEKFYDSFSNNESVSMSDEQVKTHSA